MIKTFPQRLFCLFCAAALSASLFSCSVLSPLETTSETTVASESLPSESVSDPATSPVITDPPAADPTPIETDGGVVLIGSFERTAEGWFFLPEVPLDVTFTYFLDYPMHFESLTRIPTFDKSVDGFDKSLYVGMAVTVRGKLELPRGTETLHLLPYAIDRGRTESVCRSAPELQPPNPWTADYDPTLPLPEKMQISVKDGHYVFNPYRLSEETLAFLGNGFCTVWIDFVDALLNYETSCPCPEKQYAELLSSVAYYELPLFSEKIQINPLTDWKNGILTWTYEETRQEHEARIAAVTNAANSYLAGADPTAGERERARAIYHAFCTQIHYDYDAMETRIGVEPYNAYLRKSGVCVTFAEAYAQLLCQAGIRATLVTGVNEKGEVHAWDLVTLDGEQVFSDPTWETSFQNGSGYIYFSMPVGDRISGSSSLLAQNLHIGRY